MSSKNKIWLEFAFDLNFKPTGHTTINCTFLNLNLLMFLTYPMEVKNDTYSEFNFQKCKDYRGTTCRSELRSDLKGLVAFFCVLFRPFVCYVSAIFGPFTDYFWAISESLMNWHILNFLSDHFLAIDGITGPEIKRKWPRIASEKGQKTLSLWGFWP